MGHQVVGVEIFEAALKEFFTENQIMYSVKQRGDFQVYEVCLL
jgi:hypothetical protein